MNQRVVHFFSIFGVASPILGILVISISLSLAPWFRWDQFALSNLGGTDDFGATIFNSGMLMTGSLMMLFSACLLEYTTGNKVGTLGAVIHFLGSICLLGIGFANINVEPWHWYSALGLFVSMPASTVLIGFFEFQGGKRFFPILALTCTIISYSIWLVKWPAIAIPEIISVLAITFWQILFALHIRTLTANTK